MGLEKINRVRELVSKLNKYRDSYYNDSDSKVSDYEYDTLFDELKRLEEETGCIMSNSPTQTVGYEVKSALEKHKHSHPMLSLDKTKSISDLIKFVGDKDCLLMHKLDGLTVLLTYENGTLKLAETRGNAEEGEIITHNAKVFKNIPLTIPYKGHFEIEGEAIITYGDFEKINRKLISKAESEANKKGLKGKELDKYIKEHSYKNPRNLVSGSVRQLDSSIADNRNIQFIVWKVPTDLGETYADRFEKAREFGFDVVKNIAICKYDSAEDYDKYTYELKTISTELGIPIDGLVVAYNDIQYGESLGTTGHHPRHSIAFKFYDEEVTTILKDVEWSMGKTGDLTPVAIFDEVELEGTSVSRASLHNISICKELQLGIGDEITVYKANAIIPQVKENLTKSNNLIIPSICPVCGGITEIVKDKDTEVLKCTNAICNGRLLGRLTHFVSKKGMDIDGLSESTLAKFVELGWVKNLFDIYGSLHTHYVELIDIEGFGERSVEKLDSAIENSKDVELKNFITSLSIPGIGSSQSKELAKKFKTWDAFSEAGFGNYDFSELEGFGNILDKNIHIWFSTMWNEDRIGQLVRNMRFKDEKSSVSVNCDLSGLTFVITGSLNQFSNRDAAKEEIELHNGKVLGSVSAKTDYLVNNDISSSSGKNKKAKELGIPIINEEQLIAMLR